MSLNRAVFVCLGVAAVAAAQVAPPAPATPPAPTRGRTVISRSVAKRGYLGIGLKADGAGVEITHVNEDSPAEKAGLKVGDNITEVNGQKVENVDEFIETIGDMSPGAKVGLTLMRGGAKQSVTATLQARPVQILMSEDLPEMKGLQEALRKQLESLKETHPEVRGLPRGNGRERTLNSRERSLIEELQMPGIMSPRIGFEGETVTSQLAEYFGVKEGVLVRSVTANTPAAKAGLKAGDVITKVSGTPVSSPREISGLVRANKKPMTFTVMRNRKELTLNIEIAQSTIPPLTRPDRQAL